VNRREFTKIAFSILVGIGCSCWRSGRAAAANDLGCRSAGPGSGSVGELRSSSGYVDVDNECRRVVRALSREFGVSASFTFYNDAEEGERGNAQASAASRSAGEPDGTVFLGVNLVAALMKEQSRIDYASVLFRVILAHEFAHIRQFKEGMDPAGPWQMEPHADFLAGWFVGRSHKNAVIKLPTLWTASQVEAAAREMFERGDLAFNTPDHHGHPEMRAAMVRSGYESGASSIENAFRKALAWARVPAGYWPSPRTP
jgi:hypothetical protein